MRTIPETVHVKGLTLSVEQVTHSTLAALARDWSPTLMAYCDILTKRILILTGVPTDVKWRLLFHEVKHAMNDQIEEAPVDEEAGNWFAFCADNGLLS